MATTPINLIEGGNLNQGSSGVNVSQLQQFLKSNGYYQGNTDGLYGPKTKAAIRQFQQDTGIAQDGIFGPVTQSKMLEFISNPLKAQMNDPVVKAEMEKDPRLANALNGLQKEGGNRADMVASSGEIGKGGYYLGAGFTVSPDRMKQFYDLAKKQLDPEFNERLKYYENDFKSSLEKERADYQDKLSQAEDKFGTDRFSLQNQQGQTNNVNSSLGAKQRTGMVDNYNKGLEGMKRDTSYRLSDMARKYENQLGTSDVSKFNFQAPTSSVGWWSGANRGNTSMYNPMGDMQGSLRQQYASQVEQYGKQKAQEYYNPLYN